MRSRPVGLTLWLILFAAVQALALLAVWRFFVLTPHGQALDTIALTGTRIGQATIEGRVNDILDAISVVSLAAATAFVGFIALVRRRIALAIGALLLIGGANVTTQLAKQLLVRPEFGIDPERAAVGNSLPSGHTTVAASVAVALVLVLPARLRGIGAVLGAVTVAMVGVATLSAGWHRPSDAVAAALVVGVWTCVAALFVIAAQRHHGEVEYGRSHRWSLAVLFVAGLLLLAGATLALAITNDVYAVPPQELGRRRLFVAYAGGAMAIAGAAGMLLASVLATVHRVAPQVVAPPALPEPELAATG